MPSAPREGHPHRCTAQSKQTGERCKAFAVPGREKCRHHGGAQKRGMDHHLYKDGRYSKARYIVPAAMQATYEELRKLGPDLLESTDEIALVLSRIHALMAAAEADNPFTLSADVYAAFGNFSAAMAGGNKARTIETFSKLEQAINRSQASSGAFDEVGKLLELVRRQRETEQKRIIAAQKVVTAGDVHVFFMQVQNQLMAALDKVRDADDRAAALRAFSNGMERVLTPIASE